SRSKSRARSAFSAAGSAAAAPRTSDHVIARQRGKPRLSLAAAQNCARHACAAGLKRSFSGKGGGSRLEPARLAPSAAKPALDPAPAAADSAAIVEPAVDPAPAAADSAAVVEPAAPAPAESAAVVEPAAPAAAESAAVVEPAARAAAESSAAAGAAEAA